MLAAELRAHIEILVERLLVGRTAQAFDGLVRATVLKFGLHEQLRQVRVRRQVSLAGLLPQVGLSSFGAHAAAKVVIVGAQLIAGPVQRAALAGTQKIAGALMTEGLDFG